MTDSGQPLPPTNPMKRATRPEDRMTELLGVKMPGEEIEQLYSLARYHGTTASSMVRQIVRLLLENAQPPAGNIRQTRAKNPEDKLTEMLGVKMSMAEIEKLHAFARSHNARASVIVRVMIRRLIARLPGPE